MKGISGRPHIELQIASRDARPLQRDVAILRRRDDRALDEAAAWDALAEASGIRPRLFGLSLAVKACFDVDGWPTTAASKVLADRPAAQSDALLVAALRRHGAIVTSQTNMTEFAFGALGLNPHHGTPRSPLDPTGERIAGGSTSGGAVAVAMKFADAALGSDTSGSVRIPAAFCGLVGFKPSRGRYPDQGMLFLSPTFDVPGFIAQDVETCARVDGALTGDLAAPADGIDLKGRRFLLPADFALEGADPAVVTAFQRALEALEAAGAELVEQKWPELATYGPIAVEGGIIVAEAFAWHRTYLLERASDYDPRVGPRIATGGEVRASDYIAAKQKLSRLGISYHQRLAGFDAMITPTVPMLPPRVSEVENDESYYPANRLSFRLTEIANRIDAPSVSLPMSPDQPLGLMLTGHNGGDRRLLELSSTVQSVLQESWS